MTKRHSTLPEAALLCAALFLAGPAALHAQAADADAQAAPATHDSRAQPESDSAPKPEPDSASGAKPKPTIQSRVQHVPLHETRRGRTELVFRIRHAERVAEVVLYVRAVDAASVRGQAVRRVARRAEAGYVVSMPAELVRPPAVEYWVTAREASGAERPVFASSERAQRVEVFLDESQRREVDDLARRGGHRSSAFAGAEWVDFGDRPLLPDGEATPDRYYRAEAGYAYHFMSFVDDIRLAVVHVRGAASQVESSDDGPRVKRFDPGIDFGRASVGIRLATGVRLRGALLLGASQDGFESGAGAEVVLGDPEGNHLRAGAERLSTLGLIAGMHMGFMATDAVPMGAGIEVTDFPVGDGHGVRLLYDVGYRFAPASELMLRAGFQGRSSLTGGPSIGLRTRFAF